jgi:hypothetical protein
MDTPQDRPAAGDRPRHPLAARKRSLSCALLRSLCCVPGPARMMGVSVCGSTEVPGNSKSPTTCIARLARTTMAMAASLAQRLPRSGVVEKPPRSSMSRAYPASRTQVSRSSGQPPHSLSDKRVRR